MTAPWTRVEPLAPHHDLDVFRSGRDTVDTWLRETARRAASVATHLCVDDGGRVVGFFALRSIVSGADEFPSALLRGPREDVAAILLAQMGLDDSVPRNQGHGTALFYRAVQEAALCHSVCRIQYLVLDAADDELVEWYERRGMKRIRNTRRLAVRFDKIAPRSS